MSNFTLIKKIRSKYAAFSPYLNEKTRRIWAAMEAESLGEGGISQVSLATGISRTTIYAGLKELHGSEPETSRIRSVGGGRKATIVKDTLLIEDLKSMLEDSTRGDPESPLQWTSKSGAKLTEALQQMGHSVSARTVNMLLHQMGYSLQSNRKSQEGSQKIDRDAQFHHISKTVQRFHRTGNPVISVDAKKKELVGLYKNQGREWQERKHPIEVNVHDFPDEELGKVLPYGVYDVFMNQGWVSVGVSHDTAELAVETIRRWWYEMGEELYPNAQKILVTADSGGSNSARSRLWKLKLQELADELKLSIQVCHFPPGTSKWNKIEHRLFCHITQNWRGRPLVSRAMVVQLISHTTTKQGLTVKAKLDKHQYRTKIKVNDEQFDSIILKKNTFHGEWNYEVQPRATISTV
jgi:transposase